VTIEQARGKKDHNHREPEKEVQDKYTAPLYETGMEKFAAIQNLGDIEKHQQRSRGKRTIGAVPVEQKSDMTLSAGRQCAGKKYARGERVCGSGGPAGENIAHWNRKEKVNPVMRDSHSEMQVGGGTCVGTQ